ncbi:NgoFVII family restriction endonuclease [Trichlorobacter lovleyi]|uniref:phospholipase D family protein n=1 Tax=Trichlorobacter lovleyi TaxID=313985 RepID=UPI00223EA393|nr:phospholipase D family protein [Trichlorobacter lovleyi]QOX77401.1 NgoFVII family restriction endonuclease [Trichlorobacter lovleyi]
MKAMSLFLHSPDSDSKLTTFYEKAFSNAIELYIVTAYLTDWNEYLRLNKDCKSFRVIIGKDFGITKKDACQKLLNWLPSKRKGQFLVADLIGGFHPKAVFWKEANQKCFAIIGSSNLTKAAFETNYEANVYSEIPNSDFILAKEWILEIEDKSVVVSEDWLTKYSEANRVSINKKNKSYSNSIIANIKLPSPRGIKESILVRREQLSIFNKYKSRLKNLFYRCANDVGMTSIDFYNELQSYWGFDVGDRMQGKGWEILGKHSNFKELSLSFMNIIEADKKNRDDVVVEEIDRLSGLNVPTRKAFLSEMLCLFFPNEYPLLNTPVISYLKKIKFRPPRDASEGTIYIDIARKLRFSLKQNPDHPAKNLAELDTVIWSST